MEFDLDVFLSNFQAQPQLDHRQLELAFFGGECPKLAPMTTDWAPPSPQSSSEASGNTTPESAMFVDLPPVAGAPVELENNFLIGFESFVEEYRAKMAALPKNKKCTKTPKGQPCRVNLGIFQSMIAYLSLDAPTSVALSQTCSIIYGQVRKRNLLVGRSVRIFFPAILLYALSIHRVARTTMDVYLAASHEPAFKDKPANEQQIARWYRFLVKELPRPLQNEPQNEEVI